MLHAGSHGRARTHTTRVVGNACVCTHRHTGTHTCTNAEGAGGGKKLDFTKIKKFYIRNY